MNKTMTKLLPFGAAVGALCILAQAVPAQAQPLNDHLKCYKAKDGNKFKEAIADLVPLQDPPFPVKPGCKIKLKGKQVCIPVSKTLNSTSAPAPLGLTGLDLVNDYICYKVKCDKQELPDLVVSDQFGSRTIEKLKAVKWLCAPAVKGAGPTTTTSTVTTTSTTTVTTTITIPTGDCCWTTPLGRTTYTFCDNPIPADFFEPGSEPFDGTVVLRGANIPPVADTVVRRLEGMTLGPAPSMATVPVELVALSLACVDPIDIGGSGAWDVAVGLSQNPQPQGTMTVRRTHDNGGTFTSELPVLPRFTFYKVSNPTDVRVLDLGVEGMPAVQFETVAGYVPPPWVRSLTDPPVATPCESANGFIPGIDEDPASHDQWGRPVVLIGDKPNYDGAVHEVVTPGVTLTQLGACCVDAGDGVGQCQVVTPDVCGGQGGLYIGDATDCSDGDNDGVPSAFETNDCTSCNITKRGPCSTGTDPNNPDTDGGGIPDGQELQSFDDPCDPVDDIP